MAAVSDGSALPCPAWRLGVATQSKVQHSRALRCNGSAGLGLAPHGSGGAALGGYGGAMAWRSIARRRNGPAGRRLAPRWPCEARLGRARQGRREA